MLNSGPTRLQLRPNPPMRPPEPAQRPQACRRGISQLGPAVGERGRMSLFGLLLLGRSAGQIFISGIFYALWTNSHLDTCGRFAGCAAAVETLVRVPQRPNRMPSKIKPDGWPYTNARIADCGKTTIDIVIGECIVAEAAMSAMKRPRNFALVYQCIVADRRFCLVW